MVRISVAYLPSFGGNTFTYRPLGHLCPMARPGPLAPYAGEYRGRAVSSKVTPVHFLMVSQSRQHALPVRLGTVLCIVRLFGPHCTHRSTYQPGQRSLVLWNR